MNAGAIRDDNRSIPKAEPARPRLVGGTELLREPTQAPADAVPLMYPLPQATRAGLDNERTQAHIPLRALASRLSVTRQTGSAVTVTSVCASVSMDCTVLEMEDKPYSVDVDSSDDINIEEEEEEHIEETHSEFCVLLFYFIDF